MCARWQVLPICSYPRVNPCGYEYGSPVAYPLENPYPHGGYRFFGGLGMGMAPDTHGLPMLLPRRPPPDDNNVARSDNNNNNNGARPPQGNRLADDDNDDMWDG